MEIDDIFGDGQTQTGSSGLQGPGTLHPVKLIKYFIKLVIREIRRIKEEK